MEQTLKDAMLIMDVEMEEDDEDEVLSGSRASGGKGGSGGSEEPDTVTCLALGCTDDNIDKPITVPKPCKLK